MSKDELKDLNSAEFAEFSADFDGLVRLAQKTAEHEARERSQMRDFTESDKYERTKAHNEEFLASGGKRPVRPKKTITVQETPGSSPEDELVEDSEVKEMEQASTGSGEEDEQSQGHQLDVNGEVVSPLQSTIGRLVTGAGRGKRGIPIGRKKRPMTSAPPSAISPTKKTKKMAQPTRLSRQEAEALDVAASRPGDAYLPSAEQLGAVGKGMKIQDMQTPADGRSDPIASGGEPKADSGVFSFFKNLTGGAPITEEALEPVLEKTRMHLVNKNVAANVADNLCQALKQGLVGQSKGSFRGLASLVQENLEQSLTRILSPKHRVNILADIEKSQRAKKPYTVVFCGVNGVGKSTNLAKVCFWLLENKKRICIAAGDTFRAGAVEQLRTHVKRLHSMYPPAGDGAPNIILYDKGYGKDDAGVASEAIKFGRLLRFIQFSKQQFGVA